jgi:YVTN family beta-propeller protein
MRRLYEGLRKCALLKVVLSEQCNHGRAVLNEFAGNERSMTSKLLKNLFRSSLLVASVAVYLVHDQSAGAQKPYKIETKWSVGGEGGWDYLLADSAANRLYVTHGARVEILDLKTGQPLGAITGLKGTHGVALDDAGNFGYISDGGASSVVVFDRTSLKTVATIPAGTNPDGILFEPTTKTVWAFNGRSKDVTVIDAATRRVVATVALPGKPEFPTADGKGNVFDNIEDKNEIVRLDARKPGITAVWPLTGCDSPSGMAIDLAGGRLFSACDNKTMAVVDSGDGKILATPMIGDGPDAAGYDPNTKLAFSSNGDGSLSVVKADAAGYKVVQTLKTEPRARTMALDPRTGKVYLVTAQFGPIPAATAENPRPRPTVLPQTFTVIVAGHD